MASRLNPCGPAQTYVIGRVWACSCAAGFPSPSAVSLDGMGSPGGAGHSPAPRRAQLTPTEVLAFSVKPCVLRMRKGRLVHKLNAAPCRGAGGVVERDMFISQRCGAVRTSFSSAGVLIQVSVHGKI